MSDLAVAGLTLACVLDGALLGGYGATVLPEHHLSAESKDSVKQMVGVLATLSALVLGLLVASAKSSYDAKFQNLSEMAAKLIVLDQVMAKYGDESVQARGVLRSAADQQLRYFWPSDEVGALRADADKAAAAPLGKLTAELVRLSPRSEGEKALQLEAIGLAADLSRTRWVALAESGGTIPGPFLAVLVLWLTSMFAGLGLITARNGTVMLATFVCALAVSAAILLILELDTPYHGLIRISDLPLRLAADQIGR